MTNRLRRKIRVRHRSLAFLVLLLTLGARARAATTTYAATTTGPYKSTDGGVTWQSVKVTVSNSLLQGLANVSAIAVDPANPAKVYFLGSVTGVSAFFKSTDGGQTWSAVLMPGVSGNPSPGATLLCIDPVVTNDLYLKAGSQLLRSTDSGATWTGAPGLSAIAGLGGVIGIAIDPNTSGVVYATSSGGGIHKSTDFGSTWTSFKFSFSPTLGGIFVDPANSQRLYVARRFGQGCLDQNRVFIDCGLFKSVDAGLTWQIVPIPGTTTSVAFDRTTGDIYAGASQPGNVETVIKSSDQGITWTPLVKGAGGTNDGPFVLADPGAAGNVYSLGDTGAFGGSLQKTTDSGATWKKVTVPPYCSGTAVTCPSGTSITPSVAGLAYVFAAPPPPPAVSVTGTVSAASLQPGPVAAESIVIATGSHIATGTATADIDQPPMMLAGTTVNVTDSAGVTRQAVLFSVSATQVMYQIPPGTAAGPANVTITAGDGVTGTVQVQIAAVAPGVYTLNSAGLVKAFVIRVSNGNQFVEDVYEIDPTGAVIARPITISNGDQVYLIAYGTGFRAAGSGGVAVTIGADSPPVLYAGPQGEAVGVDQFNILIPPDLAAGGQQVVPIVLTAGGQTANTVNVTVQ